MEEKTNSSQPSPAVHQEDGKQRKSSTLFLVVLILLIIIAGGVAVFYFANRGFSSLSSNKEKKYCCLPTCQELTLKECSEIDGKISDKEKCSEVAECKSSTGTSQGAGGGYQATAQSEETTDAALGSGHYTFTFKVHSCENKINSADWQGSWNWLWTYTNPAGSHQDPASADISFTTDGNGGFTTNIGTAPATGRISDKSIELEFEMPGVVGKVTATGTVSQGSSDSCQE